MIKQKQLRTAATLLVSSAKHAIDICIERHVKGRRLLIELRARTVYDCTTDRKLKDKKHAMSAITVL